jgi:1-aminocyclopropane-1-carboxylate deaminase/D-cysteine desulfhydrase-like pyridoxal-dependent ACC family enzyme
MTAQVARRTGLLLDPVYTGKAMYGLLSELRKDGRALGERLVFLHSGGVFGLLAASEDLAQVLGDA